MAALQALCSSSPSILPKGYSKSQFQGILSIGFIRRNPSLFPVSTGCRALIPPLKKLYSVPKALANSAAVVSNDLIAEDLKSSKNLDHGVLEGDDKTISEGEYKSIFKEEDKIIPEENEEDIADEDELDEIDEEIHMIVVCEKLMDVFLVDKPNPADWRKMLAFSTSWVNIRDHFFVILKERADAEDDPGMKQKLLRLERKLKEIDEDVQRHSELLEAVRAAPSKIDAIVKRRRKDFTTEFFQHVCSVASSYYENPKRQDELIELVKECVVSVEAHDAAIESKEALESIELQFNDILNSSKFDIAGGKADLFGSSGGKIDFLAGKHRMDSDAVQIAMKAWSDGRPTDWSATEATDFELETYVDALRHADRQLPGEIRILKYIITIDDPEQKLAILRDAFTPPKPNEKKHIDLIYVEPLMLLAWIKIIVHVYSTSREDGLQMAETKYFMRPRIIKKLLELEKFVAANFL